MGVRRGGQEGALAPLAGQKVCFSSFLKKIICFRHLFRQIVCFCPRPGKFCPGKKSADAHGLEDISTDTFPRKFEYKKVKFSYKYGLDQSFFNLYWFAANLLSIRHLQHDCFSAKNNDMSHIIAYTTCRIPCIYCI
jgi:hypothetical protein